MTWTEGRVTELKRLWEAGVGTQEIGERIGVSKNAAIGKAHRIGLKPRRTSAKRRAAELRKLNGRVCQWPFGDPGEPDFHMCGELTIEGKSYCPEHYARAYIPMSRPRDARQNANAA